MKSAIILNLFLAGAILFGATACKKKPVGITSIPNQPAGLVPNKPTDINTGGGGLLGQEQHPTGIFAPDENGSIPIADRNSIEGRPQDRSKFASDTVYFAFDSSAVRPSEKSKLEDVANYFKSNPAGDLLVEGHCDERGTEGYNLSLGDKRANSLREYLVNLGVSPERIHTVSFGEAKPAVDGHNEAAYSKNRRGEFVFIEPAK